MKKKRMLLTRGAALALTAAVVVSALVPALLVGRASAGIPTSRKITMADSSADATDVTYSVSFVTDQSAAAADIGGIVVDFCDSPIIGAACNTPTSFNTNEAGPLAIANLVGVAGFTLNAATDANTVILSNGTPDNTNSGVTISFDLGAGGGTDGMHNPSLGNYSFYARILTFDTAAHAVAYDPTVLNQTGLVDAGGVALSTANQLVITSKVQERLTFCVYTVAAAGDAAIATCADIDDTVSPGHSAIALGDDKGVLSPSGPFVDKTAKMRISTNAATGAAVVMKGTTLTSGANTITAMDGTADDSTPGSEEFGMCMYQESGTGFTISNVTYNDTNCSAQTSQTAGTAASGGAGTAVFGFDDNASDGTTSASGESLGTKVAGTQSKAVMAFLGNIAWETQAGIYQTTLTFVATGTY